jgi:hypothetical protein
MENVRKRKISQEAKKGRMKAAKEQRKKEETVIKEG